jgi:hypothetical protein
VELTEKEIRSKIQTKTTLISYWTIKKRNGKKYVSERSTNGKFSDVPIDDKLAKLRKEREDLKLLLKK